MSAVLYLLKVRSTKTMLVLLIHTLYQHALITLISLRHNAPELLQCKETGTSLQFSERQVKHMMMMN